MYGTDIAITALLLLAVGTIAAILIYVRRLRRLQRDLIHGVDEISGNFSLWDRNERLVFANAQFKAEMEDIPETIKVGDSFEDYIRMRIEHEKIIVETGREEDWISERLALHRNPPSAIEVELKPGSWSLVNTRKTKSGGVIVHGIDVSDFKKAQITLAESEKRFREFASAAADWFWETDAEHRFSHISDNLFDLTGLQPEKLIGMQRTDMHILEEDRPSWGLHLKQLEQREPFREIIYRRPIGNERYVWVSVSGVPHYDASGAFAGYRGVGREINELVEAREALELSEAKAQNLAEAERKARLAADIANTAKSEFLASMSHEFRTPLNAIMGFGQVLLLDNTATAEARREHAQMIVQSGQHLLSLVSEILDLAAIEAGQLKLNNVRLEPLAIAEDVVRTMQPVAEQADVTLYAPSGPSAMALIADVTRFRQVLLNLLSNAIKYNRTGGSVKIIIAASDGRQRISVVDTGFGIGDAHKAQVFSTFNRLGAEGSTIEGAGIGLALTKHLVTAMGGEIGFESTEGVGSEFWIDFPIAEAAVAA